MALHGVEGRNEQESSLFTRDIGTTGEAVSKFIGTPAVGVVGVSLAGACVIAPGLADVFFLGGMAFMGMYFTKPLRLPFRLPKFSGKMDHNDLRPGKDKKPQKSQGISFYGNTSTGNNQVWFNNDDLRRHAIIFGTTGSGKSEALISIAFNSLIQGSGFLYCDGKGDNGVYWSLYSMIRRMGREDDMLVVNYMTGGNDVRTSEKMISNTLNPFYSGSSSALSELLASLMGSSDGGNDMWANRALTFVSSLVKVLCYLRDQGEIVLSINLIRTYMTLERLHELYRRADDLPADYVDGLIHYLKTLPGMDPRQLKTGKFSETVLDQHGYITMQLTHSMNMLSDDYGHIFKVDLGDVDFYDVVVNRRILIVLLPALEKSPASLGNLGKVIVASLKQMMAYGLGSQLEGERETVIDAKPTVGPAPYTIILDEYGYYSVEGAAVMPAQARSLGFSMIFAGQDYQAFRKGDEEGAASIVANCAVKICMKLEDPTDTYDIFFKRAGEAEVSVTQSFNRQNTGLFNRYMDAGNVGIEKRGRINIRDLANQSEGEAHLIFGDSVCRMNMFYAAPPKVNDSRLNDFIRVHKPSANEVDALSEGFEAGITAFLERMKADDKSFNLQRIDELEVVANALADGQKARMGHMEASIAAFVDIEKNSDRATDELFSAVGVAGEEETSYMPEAPAPQFDDDDPFAGSIPAPAEDSIDNIFDDLESDMPEPPAPVDIPEPRDRDVDPEEAAFNRAQVAIPHAASILEEMDREDSGAFTVEDSDVSVADKIRKGKEIAVENAKKQAEKMSSGANYPKKPKPRKKSVSAMLSLLEEIENEASQDK